MFTPRSVVIPTEYVVNIILDPCRFKGWDCCMSTYGTGEYIKSQVEGDDGEFKVAAAQLVGTDPRDKRNAIVVNETGFPISYTER